MATEIVNGSTRASTRPFLRLVATGPRGSDATATDAEMIGAFASYAIAELPHWGREGTDILVDRCMQRLVLWTLWDQWKWENGFEHVERIDLDEIAERVLEFNETHGSIEGERRLTVVKGGMA